jgi:dATP pyrophosphohydrolase
VSSRGCKYPESVLVVVYSATGDVLMLQRRHPANCWQSVTGSLEQGENPPAAARRELREETGLDIAVVDCHRTSEFKILPAWRDRYAPGTETNLEHVFVACCPEQAEIELNPHEHSAYRWLPRIEAAELATFSTNRDAILEYVTG